MAEPYLSLIVFTLLIGLCTGTFIYFALWQMNRGPSETQQKLSLKVMSVLLVCLAIALLASATHLGKPFRFLNAFRNPGSMIAQEGIWSIALGIILLVAVILVFQRKNIPKWLYIVGGIVSLGLLMACSMVYIRSFGCPAWNSGVTIVYFFGSAILLGAAGMYLIIVQQGEGGSEKRMASVALAAVFLQMIVTVAFAMHLMFGVTGVTLPTALGMNVFRWGIGLLAPALIAYLAWSGKLKGKNAAWSFLACVLVGEIFSRLLFYMQGVHL